MTRFTEKQQQVINFNNGNLVVSASAGSGKTSVMIERIIRLILEGHAQINEILAVTFTKAAASEMKQRIAKALIEKIKSGDNSELLKKQLEALPLASISTVHSFCSNLLRTYFYDAEIDSQFIVMNKSDVAELKKRAIDDVFDALYENEDKDLFCLLEIYVSHRSDEELRQLVIQIYDYASSERDMNEFLEKSLFYCSEEGKKEAVNRLMDLFVEKVQGYVEAFENMKERADNECEEKLSNFFNTFAATIKNSIIKGSLRDTLLNMQGITLKKPTISKKAATDFTTQIGNEHSKIKSSFNSFIKTFFETLNSADDVDDNFISDKDILTKLIKVVKLFELRYSELKLEINALDFSDLEHKTYELLQKEKTREEISSSYKYIFVDEYQDTNGIQEAIFNCLSRKNLFIVGDLKQSIYSFRGCNPDIFKTKISACEKGYGLHIDLDSNFRSASAVINATNNVFGGIMKEDNAGVDYRKSPMIGGTLYGEHFGEAKLHIVEDVTEKEELDIGVYSVKKHLQEMKESQSGRTEQVVANIILSEFGSPFYDVKLGCERPLSFGDFAVLTQRKSGLSDRIVAEFIKCGIPVLADSKRSIGEYPEVKLIINILQFVASPMRDIPLATVMKSAIGGFSDQELSKIRQTEQSGYFYQACMAYVEQNNDETKQKIVDLFEYFDRIRLIAQFETAGSILHKIISERNLDISLLAQPLGEVKMSRVNRFVGECNDKTVWELLSKLSSILSDMSLSEVGNENSVKIMTCHSSKGLEFPVVVLPDISENFFKQDMVEDVMFDRVLGIGIKSYNLQTMVKKNTFVRNYMKIKRLYERSADSMRLLYVSMTRAKYKLHLIAKNKPSEIHRADKYIKATKMLDFLAEDDLPIEEVSETNTVYKMRETRELILGQANQDICKKIKEFVEYKYPYENDTTLSLKKTVTSIASSFAEENDSQEAFINSHPLFNVEAKEVGVAYHKFLQLCDFKNEPSCELERLLESGLLTREQGKMISTTTLNNIVGMQIFQKFSTMKLYREQPFIINVPANIIGQNSNEKVLVQGIIDLLAVSGDKAYIVDYKFSNKSDEALKATYFKQVELYAYAVEQVLKLKIDGKMIINLQNASLITL